MTREIFAELTQRLDVRPISWNKVGKLLYGTWSNRIWFPDPPVCGAPVRLPVRNGEAKTRSLNFVPQLFRGAKQNPNDSYEHVLATLR